MVSEKIHVAPIVESTVVLRYVVGRILDKIPLRTGTAVATGLTGLRTPLLQETIPE